MNVIDISLRRPVTVIISTIAVVVFGLMSYGGMGMQDTPDIDLPVVSVSTTMTGATAAVMDNDVTDVLEEQLNSISGISSLSSASYQGQAVTTIEFDIDRDIDDAAADVRDKVNLALADLPDEAETPTVSKLDVGDSSLVQIAVTGDASYKEKVHYVDKILKTKLQAINGVGEVVTPGMREREIRIWVDPERLRSRGLVTSDITDAVNKKHVELPAGSVILGRSDVDVRVMGEYASVEELKNLAVAVRGGTVIRLADVADVADGFENRENVAQFNDDDTILVGVKKQRGVNEVQLCDDVVSYLHDAEKSLPSGIGLKIIYNQSDFIRRSLSGVTSDVFSAVLLCALLMLFFMQTLRATFVTVITIPVCLIGSFILMRYMGITLNNLSMMGISLAVGMVVDATTVVMENVDRRMKGGLLRYEAAREGANEVSFSVIGGALTTIAVFSPVAFMSGVIGKLFFAFGVTVILTISLSLVLSMTLTPFLCSRILDNGKPGRAARICGMLLSKLERGYRLLLKRAVAHRAATMAVAAGMFVIGMVLVMNTGTQFMADDDESSFMIKCELPSGTEIEESGRVFRELGRAVRRHKAVEYTYANIGTDSGNQSNNGTLYVQLYPKKQRGDINKVMDEVRALTAPFRDVTATFTTFAGKDVEMVLVGGNTATLLDISKKIIAEAEAGGNVRDVETDVRIDKPQLEVEIDRGLADTMDIDVRSMSNELQAYLGGTKAGVYKEDGYRYDIRVMAERAKRSDAADIGKIYFKTGAGDIIQAPGVLSVRKTLAPNVVKRYSRQRSLSISANVTRNFSTGEAAALLTKLAGKYIPRDSGVSLVASGQTKTQQEEFARLFTALVVAIILVYVIMAIQFESFIHPFAIMFTLPLLTPGAFGLLWLSGCKLNMMSYMGLILLVGIVVNNGIILIDFIKQERERCCDKVQAVVRAAPMRLRAILITALSTLIGAIPAALKLSEGSESRQPMSVAIFGGLFTSTLLTLFVVPVVYLILDDVKERACAWARRRLKSNVGRTEEARS